MKDYTWCKHEDKWLHFEAKCHNDKRKKGDRVCPYKNKCVKGEKNDSSKK